MPGLAFYAEEDRVSTQQVSAWDSVAAAWRYDLYIIDPTEELVVRGNRRAYGSLSALTASQLEARFVYFFQQETAPEGWEVTPLPDFKHPEEYAIYVVGSNRTGIPTAELSAQNGSCIVNIEVADPKPDRGLWSFDCGLIIVYDRFLKQRLGV